MSTDAATSFEAPVAHLLTLFVWQLEMEDEDEIDAMVGFRAV